MTSSNDNNSGNKSGTTSGTDSYGFPKKGIHRHVKNYIESLGNLSGQVAVDIPAGDGRASYSLLMAGAKVQAFDLFPNFFKLSEASCTYADLKDRLPIEDDSVDMVLSQEGLEHISDQVKVFQEFNRILKPKGLLLLTTPNLSHMRARLSMFLLESDFWKRPPASEIDSIWFSSKESNELYFGHLFLLNVQKLRSLAAVSGFRIKEVVQTDIGATSLILTLLFYPLLFVATLASCLLYLGKLKNVPRTEKYKTIKEQMKLNLHPKILLGKHLFIVFEKAHDLEQNIHHLKSLSRANPEENSALSHHHH